MNTEINTIIQGMIDEIDRIGRITMINAARLINNHLGYEKYAVWVPENEVIKI